MTCLPIVERELRVASRRPITYWLRLGLAFVLTLVFLWLIARPGMRNQNTVGHEIFFALTLIGLAYALVVGVFFTSDCLSSEKREGTLGLLFLTDLKSYDVVAGKVFATSIGTFYALFAIFPIMALPLLIGGVTGAEFWRMTVVLCVTTLFSLAVGTLVSALNREEWQSMTVTASLLLLVAGIMPALWGTFFQTWKSPWLDATCLLPSPGYAFRLAFERHYQGTKGAELFWSSVAVISGITVASFVSASLLLPNSWRSEGRRRPKKLDFYSQLQRRSSLLQQNPFLWLSLRLRGHLFWLSLAAFSAIGSWCFFFIKATRRSRLDWEFVVCIYGALVLFSLFKAFVAIAACRRFNEDRRSGALELLLSTPVSVSELLRGQEMSMWRQCRGVMATLAAVNIALLWLAMCKEKNSEAIFMLAVVSIGGIVTLFTDFNAMVRIGMLQGMVRRKFNIAVLMTIAQVMIVPWLAVFIVFLMMVSGSGLSEEAFIVLAVLYFTGCAIGSHVWSWNARLRVFREFRALAAGTNESSQNSFSSTGVSSQSLSDS